MDAATTREQIASRLRDDPATPAELSAAFEISREDAVSHVRHVARTVEASEERFLVRPPRCRDCGFDGFDDLVNDPSRCPECKSESIDEPAFTIRPPER
ncbi:MAG: transcriptional regulator [Halodesulfurarchaeum sp.]